MNKILLSILPALLLAACNQSTQTNIPNTDSVSSIENIYKLEGGYPAQDAIPKIYDELDYQRAVQAYIWATPLVGMEALSAGLANDMGLKNITDVGIFENFLDANTIVATGNGQSLYALGNINMSQTGPVVIEVPAKILGFSMSAWQQPLSDFGPLGPDKGKGGKYLFIPPGYTKTTPAGFFAVKSDTYLFNWTVRGFVVNGDPAPAVASIKGMKIYKLEDKDHQPPMNFVNLSGKKATLIPLGNNLSGLGYFELMSKAILREHVRPQDKQFLGMLAALGIEKGKPFNPDARTKSIFERAAKDGAAMVAAISYDSRYPKKLRWEGYSNWEELLLTEHPNYVNPNYEELDGRAALYYQAAGASKNIFLSAVGVGSKYAGAFKDKDGHWLMGDNQYKLNVPANPPVKDFWSVVVYDAITRSMIQNGSSSGVDSYKKDLQKNSDGSIDVYFGPTAPQGKESNWVKTNTGTGFFLYFRWYGPLETYFDKSWKLPDVEKVK